MLKFVFSLLVGNAIVAPTSVSADNAKIDREPTNYCYAIDALGQTVDLTHLCRKNR